MLRGTVVLVPFPFDDHSAAKVRPAVCLTEPVGRHHHVVLAFITSRPLKDPLASDLSLTFDHPDFAATGLRLASSLRLHRVMTVSTELIRRGLGKLSPALLAEMDRKLGKLFGLG